MNSRELWDAWQADADLRQEPHPGLMKNQAFRSSRICCAWQCLTAPFHGAFREAVLGPPLTAGTTVRKSISLAPFYGASRCFA